MAQPPINSPTTKTHPRAGPKTEPQQVSVDLQAGQAEVVSFLSNASSYPDDVDAVDRIETHGAIVFLAGSRVYKLKRAIRLPYLDFSTLEKREAACRNELTRNATASQEIYIGVVPVTRENDKGLKIDGVGEPVEWLVVMNRFEQEDLFDSIAGRNELDVALMDPLAEEIASYQERARQVLDHDGDEIIARVINQIVTSASYAADTFGLKETQQLSLGLVQHLTRHTNLLRMRSKSGKVRLCHGDLHLRNIVLQNGQPRLFDALEFDDTLATTDVLYDLAFLLMDLWHQDLRSHANRCFNTFVSCSMQANDLPGIALMPMLMSMRAAIRALVTVDKLSVAAEQQDAAVKEEACSYFSLANELLATREPVLVAVGGLSGTGKTTLAAAVAPGIGHAPGALHLRSDVERKRMLRVPVLEKLPPQAYTNQASHNVYRRLCSRAEQALRAGHSVVVDAVFLEPMHRRWIEKVALRCGCSFLGLWLEAEQEQLIERVTQRRFDASDADGDVVRRQFKMFVRNACWSPIDTRSSARAAISQARSVIQMHLERASNSN